MKNEIIFSEQQKFNQWWLWLILIGINGLFIYGLIVQVFGGGHFGSKPMSNIEIVSVSIIILLFTIFFLNFRLDTSVKKEGIYVRFFPFHFKTKFYAWDRINKLYLKKYSPVKDFGGWGIRIGFSGKGKAFNVSGNIGLQIEFKNGKKLLIGTNKYKELSDSLIHSDIKAFADYVL